MTDPVGEDVRPVAWSLPSSVRLASRLLWVVIGLSGLTALLTVVMRQTLLDAWAVGKPEDLTPPSFVPVAITMFVVVALLGWVLVVFFRGGHAWARWSIAALICFTAFVSVQSLWRDLPLAFDVVTAVSVVVEAALLVLLFHPDTNAFLQQD